MFGRRSTPLRRRALWALPVLLLAPAILLVGPNATKAAEEIGRSVKIRNEVNGSLGNRRLARQDPVFASEQIRAAANSHGEILLNDDSKVLVGENSVVSLDDFVVGSGGFSSGTIKVTKGAFRFITGNSAKGSLKVETPLSTIGIRGTVFDVYVDQEGLTRVLLFDGEVRVCSGDNTCLTLDQPCDIVEVSSPSELEQLPYLRSPLGNRFEEFRNYYLAAFQQRFGTQWQAPVRTCISRALLDPTPRESPQEPGGGDKNGGPGPGKKADTPGKSRSTPPSRSDPAPNTPPSTCSSTTC